MRSNHANLEVGEPCRWRSSRWETVRDPSAEDVFASDKREPEPSASCVTFQGQPGHPALCEGGALSSLLLAGALIASKGSWEYLFFRRPLCGGSKLLGATWPFGTFRLRETIGRL
jgi:hypothetical protein